MGSRFQVGGFVAAWLASALAFGLEPEARLEQDLAARRPAVIHVVVALCDNEHQGIVPVPARLGNGDDPDQNLYWGAQYGVRTFLGGRWAKVASLPAPQPEVLERSVFRTELSRGGKSVTVYLVADAWKGAEIRAAMERFLQMANGGAPERIELPHQLLEAGGSAHLVAFVGHDGLMDFSLPPAPANPGASPPRSIVLACASAQYVEPVLRAEGARPLLLTTNLMAPEAYTLEAAIRSYLAGDGAFEVREAAARAYDAYQHCGLSAARRLFTFE